MVKTGKRRSLGLWLGLRICALATLAIAGAVGGMTAYFGYREHRFLQTLPTEVREEFIDLRAQPHSNRERLWELMATYWDIEEWLSDMTAPDWMMLGVMVTCELPFLVLLGMMTARPLSRQVRELAEAARYVASGDFKARARLTGPLPKEISSLASDFNDMSTRLEQYERELRESSAMLAHELRTPLHAAMGRVQGILDEVFPLDMAQLETVHRQLSQINRLVGDLHMISLARAGQLSLEFDRFSVLALLRERMGWIEAALAKHSTACTLSASPELTVHADRDRLGQVISVLLDNALRYAHDGGVIDVSARAIDGAVEILVSDRGQTVNDESLERMKDRFWRAESSRDRNSGGSGLGLAIADSICRAHDGSLSFEIRPGGGLTAVVKVPIE